MKCLAFVLGKWLSQHPNNSSLFSAFGSSCHSCADLTFGYFTHAHQYKNHNLFDVLYIVGSSRIDSHCQIKGCITPAAQHECKWLQFTTWCNRKQHFNTHRWTMNHCFERISHFSVEIGDKIKVKPAVKWQLHFSLPQIVQVLEGWTRFLQNIYLHCCFDDAGKDAVLPSAQNLPRVWVDFKIMILFVFIFMKPFSDVSFPVWAE